MEINGVNISMIRGDSESISVNMKEDGVARSFVAGDTVYFTVKKRTSDTEKKLQKSVTNFSEGIAVIPIDHSDTKDLSTGTYYYDIQVTFADGTVRTLVGPAEFKLTDEVTYE